MPLRIGVNALYLIPGGVGGTEIYLRNLLIALSEIDDVNQYFLFVNRETDQDLCPSRPNFRILRQWVRASFRPARILWEQTLLPVFAARERLDVLFNPGFTAPVIAPCPSVTVFHDLQHKRHPEYFRWFDLPFWRIFLGIAARRSRLILTISEATRADFLDCYRTPPARVRVTPLGVEPAFFEIARQREQRAPQPYILCVSTLHPHKNLETLVSAFARLRRRRPELRLVLAGLRGFHADKLVRLISSLGLEDAVEVPGWMPRSALYALYRDALAFVYPSRFEGFGLPVLEALAAGLPTACSRIEPLVSLADEAALLFDPGSEEALLEAMTRLIEDADLRARLSRAGPQQASRYPWRRTAELTLAALVEAARSG